MPGDTKIKHCPSGWFDVDHPNVTYPSRRLARDARRRGVSGLQSSAQTIVVQSLTTLDPKDAAARVSQRFKDISYGHMRGAGATHHEALIVIALDSPAVSLSYGQARANGYNHTYALARALSDNDSDD